MFTIAVTLLAVGTVSAQTRVYITGSTAFRAATTNAINSYLSKAAPDAWDGNSSGVGSAFTSANAQIWTGSHGGNSYIVKTSWSGSSGGIQVVSGSGNFPVYYLADVGAGGSNAGQNNNDPRKGPSASPAQPFETYNAGGDIAMSDVFQGGSPFTSGTTINGVTYNGLTDNTVGVVTFQWVASNSFPGTNMTPQIAQYLYTNVGAAPICLWTGSTFSASGPIVYAGGRDPDSGTRGTAFAESGIGIFTGVQQWQPINVSGGVIGDIQLYPQETVNGILYPQGDGGESSGSTLRNYLNNTLSATAASEEGNGNTVAYLMAYLGTSDAAKVTTAAQNPNVGASYGGTLPAVALTYNGVGFSQSAVENGQYTFWGFEHLFYLPSLSGTKLTFAQGLASQISGETDAQLFPNCSKSAMHVTRSGDGNIVMR